MTNIADVSKTGGSKAVGGLLADELAKLVFRWLSCAG